MVGIEGSEVLHALVNSVISQRTASTWTAASYGHGFTELDVNNTFEEQYLEINQAVYLVPDDLSPYELTRDEFIKEMESFVQVA
jgi:hypothetical protein